MQYNIIQTFLLSKYFLFCDEQKFSDSTLQLSDLEKILFFLLLI